MSKYQVPSINEPFEAFPDYSVEPHSTAAISAEALLGDDQKAPPSIIRSCRMLKAHQTDRHQILRDADRG